MMIKRSRMVGCKLRVASAALMLVVLTMLIPSPLQPPVRAHGGVIIDGGFTDHYEWIAMASPFPVTPGETVLTVLVYDINTYAPINGLTPTLELAPPGSPRPCCQDDQTIGPLPLIVDPLLYPGDYSTILLLLREGSWQGKFTITAEDPVGPGELTEMFFTVEIKEGQEGEERPTPVDADKIAVTATALATNGEGEPATEPSPEPSPESSPESSEVSTEEGSGYPSPITEITPQPAQDQPAQDQPAQDQPAQDQPTQDQPVETSTPSYPAPKEVAPSTVTTATLAGAEWSSQTQTDGSVSGAGSAGTNNNEGTSNNSPWVSQNLWLLAALTLVPLLLIIVWFLLANNQDSEWTGEPDDEG